MSIWVPRITRRKSYRSVSDDARYDLCEPQLCFRGRVALDARSALRLSRASEKEVADVEDGLAEHLSEGGRRSQARSQFLLTAARPRTGTIVRGHVQDIFHAGHEGNFAPPHGDEEAGGGIAQVAAILSSTPHWERRRPLGNRKVARVCAASVMIVKPGAKTELRHFNDWPFLEQVLRSDAALGKSYTCPAITWFPCLQCPTHQWAPPNTRIKGPRYLRHAT